MVQRAGWAYASVGYRGKMPPRPQLGLFDNPVRVFSLEELAETVRALEGERPGLTADELSRAVFAELALKRTRRAAELVAEAIRVARTWEPRAVIAGSRWQASTARSGTGRSPPVSSSAATAPSRTRRSLHTTRHIPTARTDRRRRAAGRRPGGIVREEHEGP